MTARKPASNLTRSDNLILEVTFIAMCLVARWVAVGGANAHTGR
jgi:hypothetical protein